MNCPTCGRGFEKVWDRSMGDHDEHICECGQLLQWDIEVPSSGHHDHRAGLSPPQPCKHPDLRKPKARVPLP